MANTEGTKIRIFVITDSERRFILETLKAIAQSERGITNSPLAINFYDATRILENLANTGEATRKTMPYYSKRECLWIALIVAGVAIAGVFLALSTSWRLGL